MDWKRVCDQIPEVVKSVKNEYILNNTIIKDDIFPILEKHCVVVYYPIPDETKNRGFHIKRFLNGELRDFVYINTANNIAEQIFAAAHELGHVWRVAEKVWQKAGEVEELTDEIEERIVGRFAAELLMPATEFKRTFFSHINDLELNSSQIRFEEIIRVMVMQMTDYMVPYEAVRRRMIETSIISDEIGKSLNAEEIPGINVIVSAYLRDLYTALEESSGKKTIPGLRDLLFKAESSGAVSEYVISKIKEDFSVEGVSPTDKIIHISAEGE